jgi:hypothetical protein
MANHKIAKLGALAALTCFCSVAAPTRISTAASRPINHATGCPKDGNYSAIFAVLLDTTDSLSPVQQEIVQKKLDEFAEKVHRVLPVIPRFRPLRSVEWHAIQSSLPVSAIQ